jgi:ribosome maturation factor RimP
MRARCSSSGADSTRASGLYSGPSEYKSCSAGPSALFLLVVSAPTTTQLARIRELFQPTLTFLGYELYDLAITGTGRNTTLRVQIDRPLGITLDDCERVSKSLSALLDQADPLPNRYDLEVSSPGAEQVIELQLGEGKHQRTVAIPLADILSARLAIDLSRR